MISKVRIWFKLIWISSSSSPMHHKLPQNLQKDRKNIKIHITHAHNVRYVCNQKNDIEVLIYTSKS
jgi:hypothetical protein